jgi:hypothetical protein
MARIRHFPLVPPGGWRYVQPETGARFKGTTFDRLVQEVRAHRAYKGLPVDTVELDVEHQLCAALSEEWCKPEPGEEHRPVRDRSGELTASHALGLAKALAAFLAAGGQFVERAEVARRAAICRGCPFNKPSKFCACAAAYAAVEALVPKDRREPGISVCMACGCALQAKVNFPLAAIAASMPEGLVLPTWCWQR